MTRRPDYADRGGEAARMAQHECPDDCEDCCSCPCHLHLPPSGWRPPEWIPVTQADLRRVYGAITALDRTLSKRLTKLEKQIMSTQSDIDAVSQALADLSAKVSSDDAALNAAVVGIEAEIAALQAAQPAADVSGLQAALATLQGAVDANATDIAAVAAIVPAPAGP